MKKLYNHQGGYFTVEASMIIPTVLFCVFGILYVSFYLYDLGVVRSLLDEKAVALSDVIKTEADIEDGSFDSRKLKSRSLTFLLKSSYPSSAKEAEESFRSEISKKLLVSQINQVHFTAGWQKVTGKVTLSYRIPIPVIGNLIGNVWKKELRVILENGNNAEQMRRWDQLE
ncbi:MAG: pilus assembly protein [Lachnospiraceae bacterium]|nr:pilus assembly protein [Lachnospiraceae bacterium]